MKIKFILISTILLIFVLLFTMLFSFGASARVVGPTPKILIQEPQSDDAIYFFGFDITHKLTSGQYGFSDIIGSYNIDVSFIQDYLDDNNISYDVYRYFPIVININSIDIGTTYLVDEVYYDNENDALYSVQATNDTYVTFFPDDFTLDYSISFTIDAMPQGEGDGSFTLYLMIPLGSVGMQEFIPYEYFQTLMFYENNGYGLGYSLGYDEGYYYGEVYGREAGYQDGYSDGLTDSSDNFAQSFYSMIYESLGDILYSGNSTTHSDLVLTLLTSLVLLFILIVPILLLIFIFKLLLL